MTDTTMTTSQEAAERRQQKIENEREAEEVVVAAGDAFMAALDRAQAARDQLREALLYGRTLGVSDNRLSQFLTKAIPPGTVRLGRPVPRALMGVRRLTDRAS